MNDELTIAGTEIDEDVRTAALNAARRVTEVTRSAKLEHLNSQLMKNARCVLSPDVIVAVVGGQASGKTSMCNGFMAMPLLVADARYPTQVATVVSDGANQRLSVSGIVDGSVSTRRLAPSAMATVTTAFGSRSNHVGVFRAELTVPNPVLAKGFVLIDMPGSDTAHDGASLASGLVPMADAVIVAVPAGQGLPVDEATLIRRSIEAGVTTVVAVTKLDTVSDPAAAVGDVKAAVTREALDAEVIGVSYAWRLMAIRDSQDIRSDQASGFPRLVAHLDQTVRRRAQIVAATRTIIEARSTVAQVGAVADVASSSDDDVSEGVERALGVLREIDRSDAHWVRTIVNRFSELGETLVTKAMSEIDGIDRRSGAIEARSRLAAIASSVVVDFGRRTHALRSEHAIQMVADIARRTNLAIGVALAPLAIAPTDRQAWPAGSAWEVDGLGSLPRHYLDLAGLLTMGDNDVQRLCEAARLALPIQIQALVVDAANGTISETARRLDGLRTSIVQTRERPSDRRVRVSDESLATELETIHARLIRASQGVV